MVVRSLDLQKDMFQPKELDDEILNPEVLYLNAIGVLMYLTQCTKLYIIFTEYLLARFSFKLTRKHWDKIKHISQYLTGTIDLGLFYSKETNNSSLVGYANARYKSNPHKARP